MKNESRVFVSGVSKDSGDDELRRVIRRVFLEATNNLSWLKRGDKVLLKPALNSGDSYPATTHPVLLGVVSEEIKKRGGVVFSGDQSGVESDLEKVDGKSARSSYNYERSGMKNSGVEFVAFEDRGWDGYKKFKPKIKDSAWKDGFYITRVIDEVDHIINLPRISTHVQTGVTLGAKNWVGILRDDSRVEFHKDGPFFFAVKNFASKNKNFEMNYGNEDKFFEKICEIGFAVREKLRLTMFVGSEVQLTFGPNKKTPYCFKTYSKRPDVGVVIASSNPVGADAVALSFLVNEYVKLSFFRKVLNKFYIFVNRHIKELGKYPIWENDFLKNYLKLGLGNRDFELVCENLSDELTGEINERLGRK